jgi:hypothetical protein
MVCRLLPEEFDEFFVPHKLKNEESISVMLPVGAGNLYSAFGSIFPVKELFW